MPAEAAPKPTLAPEPPKGRLEQALDLITEEAVQVLAAGRDPRAFQKTEKLLAIARAVRLECGTRVEDVEANKPRRQGGANFVINQDPVIMGGNVDLMAAPLGGNATKDMRREEKVAQLEALAARKRRDNAEARLNLVREFKEIQELDLTEVPNEIREGIEARLAQITDDLFPPHTQSESVETDEEDEATD
jgi:hypothetical protein